MASVIGYLKSKNIGSQPKWLSSNMVYETIMGSEAYGVSRDSSDVDVYGVCIPPKHYIFPHTIGHVNGFGPKPQSFDQYQEHHLKAPERRKEYDVSVYSIVKYFHLCASGNPNMVDSMFTPDHCVLHITPVGLMIRDNRKLFLSAEVWNTFRGYAKSQIHKIQIKKPKTNEKRMADIEKFGVDLKYLYHVVRLVLECEQILMYGDVDLLRDRETLKSIRNGEWTFDDVMKWFNEKILHLEKLYAETKIPRTPDYEVLRKLLIDCLEHHYGDLSEAVRVDVSVNDILNETQDLIDRFRKKVSGQLVI